MALRLDAYAALAWQDLLRRRLFMPGGMLPEVLCVVVYTGRRRWTAPLSLGELTAAGLESRQPWQPELRYLVLDGKSPGEQDAERGRGGNRALALTALQRCGKAARRFDTAAGKALSGMLAEVRDAERFAEVGEFIVDCATGTELLEQVRRTNGRFE